MQGCHMRSTYRWHMCMEPVLPDPLRSHSGKLGCYIYPDKIPTSTKFANFDANNINVGLKTTGFMTKSTVEVRN